MIQDLKDWQRRFRAGSSIWAVMDTNGAVSSLYESRAAADVELAWRKAHGHRGFSIEAHNIHTLELAQERFSEGPGR